MISSSIAEYCGAVDKQLAEQNRSIGDQVGDFLKGNLAAQKFLDRLHATDAAAPTGTELYDLLLQIMEQRRPAMVQGFLRVVQKRLERTNG